jgi:release factor glutamine methyltransferase
VEIKRLRLNACEEIYEPREDSYMLAGCVEKRAFGKVLDLGTGSGIQGIVAALNGCDVTFCDIDPKALECAEKNAKLNGVGGKFICSDMFGSIEGKFDTIIFNPPYVVSKEQKYIALDGGKNGRICIDHFINKYKEHVNERHCVLLVESSFNGYEKDLEKLNAKVVAKEHYFFEDLVVLFF